MLLAAFASSLAMNVNAADLMPKRSILAFSKTAGFRHDSIPVARRAILDLGLERGWTVAFTEDSAVFNPTSLKGFDCVVFLNTTGDILDADQEKALEGFIRSGGGYAGVHAATDTEYDWPWYGRLVGAYFQAHPAVQEATMRIEDSSHPSTRALPNPWRRTDEWYDFRRSPRGSVTVLASLDQSSYTGSKMGADHPIIWCHEFEGGRSWYTGLGHTQESFQDPVFIKMLAAGIEWSCGKSRRLARPGSKAEAREPRASSQQSR